MLQSARVAASALTPLTVTAVLIPVAGRYVAGRAARRRPAAGFGPPRPTAGPLVRLGVPVGLAASALGVLMTLLMDSPFRGLIVLTCAAQLTAAWWATRDYAPLPIVRGLLAAYGSGALAVMGWLPLLRTLVCVLGAGPCAPPLGLKDVYLGLTLAPPGALAACAVHAGLHALRSRRRQ
ncbi:hypothetical protein [Kitasatospora cheerisanensis]|uniref:hypothetical protein n=1 Tax=Kitasatospora cheerisanensis TaxID=81942 RepID=UPI0005687A06|nr:hypothetical protein [Kitasatospora cheerisanensis]